MQMLGMRVRLWCLIEAVPQAASGASSGGSKEGQAGSCRLLQGTPASIS